MYIINEDKFRECVLFLRIHVSFLLGEKITYDFLLCNKQVAMLQRLLNQEEKFHEILEMVHNRPNGSAISIPNFLSPKVI